MNKHIEQLKWQLLYHTGSGYRYGKTILTALGKIGVAKTIQCSYSCKSHIERNAIFSPDLVSMDIIIYGNTLRIRRRMCFGMNSNYCPRGVCMQTSNNFGHSRTYSWHGSGKCSRVFIHHNTMNTICTMACMTSLARDAMLAHAQKVWQMK